MISRIPAVFMTRKKINHPLSFLFAECQSARPFHTKLQRRRAMRAMPATGRKPGTFHPMPPIPYPAPKCICLKYTPCLLRRGRDSNPRNPLEVQHISSVLHSTALAPLRECSKYHIDSSVSRTKKTPSFCTQVQEGYNVLMARYGKKAGEKVKRAIHEMKEGKLKSGRSGKIVRNRKQAIAIGLAEARRAGGKVPRK